MYVGENRRREKETETGQLSFEQEECAAETAPIFLLNRNSVPLFYTISHPIMNTPGIIPIDIPSPLPRIPFERRCFNA